MLIDKTKNLKIKAIDIGGSGVKVATFLYQATTREIKILDTVEKFIDPEWENFGAWLSMKISHDFDYMAISCAGFIDTENGIVKLFRVGDWVNRPLVSEIEMTFRCKPVILNDAEAHLMAHMQSYNHPQICISLGTSIGFAISTEEGNILRPRKDSNFDLGGVKIPTRATNNEVWWALGADGLNELKLTFGEERGYQQFGWRMGAFLVSICSMFQPRSVVFSGGILLANADVFMNSVKDEFVKGRPNWLEKPEFILSPYKADAALWGITKYLLY